MTLKLLVPHGERTEGDLHAPLDARFSIFADGRIEY
jgi:hypothetical protein